MRAVFSLHFLILSTLCGLFTADEQHENIVMKEPDSSGTIRFTAPKLNAEDEHSDHMPGYLKCDACKAIAFQMKDYLVKAESKRTAVKGKGAALSESEYVDTLEQCCSQKWEQYGLKEVHGFKRLSGPGLETADKMGMVMYGGPWPKRLFKMCHSYLGEYDETEIYQKYRSDPDSLEDFYCYANGGVCKKPSKTKKRDLSRNEL
ncbi:marginal zone B- and B1-cell-specific protein-like [Huso huso]|uniref:Marginal zone B- and B1-cell-specific protein-like n=1 Tax=Huso huso TaxID=61971 RepID=A0ABR0ZVZ1_HUSHU